MLRLNGASSKNKDERQKPRKRNPCRKGPRLETCLPLAKRAIAMYILTFIQNGYERPLALFESIEAGRRFMQSVPGYTVREEAGDGFCAVYETLNPSALPDYMEAEYNGNRIPFSRFMFRDPDTVEIVWRNIPNMEEPNRGLIEGHTPVDAYSIDNAEVQSYIARRERAYAQVKAALEKRGYEADRAFHGSEDGEAVLIKKRNETGFHFFMHLDPAFVDEVPDTAPLFEKWLDAQLQAR